MNPKVIEINNSYVNIVLNVNCEIFCPKMDGMHFRQNGYRFDIDHYGDKLTIYADKDIFFKKYIFYNYDRSHDELISFAKDIGDFVKFEKNNIYAPIDFYAFKFGWLGNFLIKIIEENNDLLVKEALERAIKSIIDPMVFSGVADKNSILNKCKNVLDEILIENIL